MSNPFANRIVGYTVKPASELTANPLNYRKHPAKQRAAVQASLRELGWIAAVIENVRTGLLVDGHERVMQALAKNESVPVLQVDLSPEEEALALATFDPITYMAETDAAALDALLRQVNTGEESLQALLAEMADNAGLDYGKAEAVEDVEPQIDRAEELRQKRNVETGQLWQLGDHRLICGDCTDKAVVERVMGGEKAAAVVTDPPYGIDYNRHIQNKKHADLQNDKTPAPHVLLAALPKVDAIYLWSRWDVLQAWIDAVPLKVRNVIVWDKQTNGMGDLETTYAPSWEVCIFASTDGHKLRGGRDRDVWQAHRPNTDLHLTPKPIDLIARCIEKSTDKGAAVFDGFSGSGTTIIACEQLGRRCRAVEISPGYVAVALERWATATGKTPVLL
jgi:hypothetical protein